MANSNHGPAAGDPGAGARDSAKPTADRRPESALGGSASDVATNITPTHVEQGGRDSGMSISLTVSIGYQRRRPNTQGDRLEARIDSVGLLIVGGVTVVVLIL